jgi:hypothetical protein
MPNITQPTTNIPTLKSKALLTLTFFFLFIAIYGTSIAGWWSTSVWATDSNRADFTLFFAAFFSIYFFALKSGLPILTLTIVPGILYIGMGGLGPIVAVIWLWACALFIGAYTTHLLGQSSIKTLSLRHAALGFAIIGTIVGFFAHVPLNFPIVHFGLFSALALLSIGKLAKKNQINIPKIELFKRNTRSIIESVLGALVLVGATLVIIVTALPDVGHDALAIHLNIPARMLEDGLWHFDVKQYIWSVMPFGADWLYVPPYFIAGVQGARLLNSSFLFGIAYACYRLLAPRIGTTLAIATPALFLSWPLSYLEAASTFVEAPLAFFFLMSLSELIESDREKEGSWIVLGALAGYACSIKLLGVVILPFLLIGAILRSHSKLFEQAKPLSLVSGICIFLFFCLPPYFVAYLKTGNPVFPFFNSIFHSPDFMFGSLFGNGDDLSNPNYKRKLGIKTLWDMSINSKSFGESFYSGALGISLIVLLPMSIATSILNKRFWIFAAICSALGYICIVFQSQAYLRYAYPVLPWFLLIGVWALGSLPYPRLSGSFFVIILCSFNLLRFPVAHWPLQQFSLNLLWSKVANDRYLLKNKPEVTMGEILSKMEEFKDKKILLLGLDPAFSSFPNGTLSDSWHSWPYSSLAVNDKSLRTSIARSNVDIVVHSVGRGYFREAELTDFTTELFRQGDVRAALVQQELIYTNERIKNPTLDISNIQFWQQNGAIIDSTGVRANVNSAITQLVSITPDIDANLGTISTASDNAAKKIHSPKTALLTMIVTCPIGQTFRSQINWMNSENKFVSTDIAVHSCAKKSQEIKRIVVKPPAAQTAIVYGGSHDGNFVTLNKISLKTSD